MDVKQEEEAAAAGNTNGLLCIPRISQHAKRKCGWRLSQTKLPRKVPEEEVEVPPAAAAAAAKVVEYKRPKLQVHD